MTVEFIFAAGYAASALVALYAHSVSREGKTQSVGGFWLRVAAVTAIFAALRLLNTHLHVADLMRDVSHTRTFQGGVRPGQIVMLSAVLALGLATAGLLLFKLRTLHRSVFIAAISLVFIILLAIAHSASLYLTGAVLQAEVGSLTLSRILEAAAITTLVASGFWYRGAARGRKT